MKIRKAKKKNVIAAVNAIDKPEIFFLYSIDLGNNRAYFCLILDKHLDNKHYFEAIIENDGNKIEFAAAIEKYKHKLSRWFEEALNNKNINNREMK